MKLTPRKYFLEFLLERSSIGLIDRLFLSRYVLNLSSSQVGLCRGPFTESERERHEKSYFEYVVQYVHTEVCIRAFFTKNVYRTHYSDWAFDLFDKYPYLLETLHQRDPERVRAFLTTTVAFIKRALFKREGLTQVILGILGDNVVMTLCHDAGVEIPIDIAVDLFKPRLIRAFEKPATFLLDFHERLKRGEKWLSPFISADPDWLEKMLRMKHRKSGNGIGSYVPALYLSKIKFERFSGHDALCQFNHAGLLPSDLGVQPWEMACLNVKNAPRQFVRRIAPYFGKKRRKEMIAEVITPYLKEHNLKRGVQDLRSQVVEEFVKLDPQYVYFLNPGHLEVIAHVPLSVRNPQNYQSIVSLVDLINWDHPKELGYREKDKAFSSRLKGEPYLSIEQAKATLQKLLDKIKDRRIVVGVPARGRYNSDEEHAQAVKLFYRRLGDTLCCVVEKVQDLEAQAKRTKDLEQREELLQRRNSIIVDVVEAATACGTAWYSDLQNLVAQIRSPEASDVGLRGLVFADLAQFRMEIMRLQVPVDLYGQHDGSDAHVVNLVVKLLGPEVGVQDLIKGVPLAMRGDGLAPRDCSKEDVLDSFKKFYHFTSVYERTKELLLRDRHRDELYECIENCYLRRAGIDKRQITAELLEFYRYRAKFEAFDERGKLKDSVLLQILHEWRLVEVYF